MGSSVSSNVLKVVTNALAKISSEIIQNTALSSDSSQIISVADVKGDVIISGNVFTQVATINTTALFTALAQESMQQKLAMEIAQEAKALTSGLNVAQFAYASNNIDVLISASISITSTISQTCSTLHSNQQSIYVTTASGSVTIENNVFNQVANIFQTCLQKAVNDSKSLQEIDTKLNQLSSATSQGLSMWDFLALGVIIIGSGVAFTTTLTKFLFPILIGVGIAFIVAYYRYTTEEISIVGYSSLFLNNASCSSTSIEKGKYKSVEEASEKCLENKNFVAFDWESSGNTIFYSKVNPECQQSLKQDSVTLLRPAVVFQGIGPPKNVPKSQNLDAYVDTVTTKWYQYTGNTWLFMKQLLVENFNTIVISGKLPISDKTSHKENDYYIHIVPELPVSFDIYEYNVTNKTWDHFQKLKGPGLVPNVNKKINASGFKIKKRNEKYLYIGIGLIIIGFIFTSFTKTKTN
jgi:hypothetical protein